MNGDEQQATTVVTIPRWAFLSLLWGLGGVLAITGFLAADNYRLMIDSISENSQGVEANRRDIAVLRDTRLVMWQDLERRLLAMEGGTKDPTPGGSPR